MTSNSTNDPKSGQDLANPVFVQLVNGAKLPPTVSVTLAQTEILNDKLRQLAAFFSAIRNRTEAISFDRYDKFIYRLLCTGDDASTASCEDCTSGGQAVTEKKPKDYGAPSVSERRADLVGRPGIHGVDAYKLLKLATEAFLIFETGIVVQEPRNPQTGMPVTTKNGDESAHLGELVTFNEIRDRLQNYLQGGTLPYLNRIVQALLGLGPQGEREKETLPYCEGILRRRFTCPSLLELIWSYWHEQGMQVQTINAIAIRFQNRHTGLRNPLANLELDPLRPLNNLFWGYLQDENNRLSVARRAYEYDHHYGLTLTGKAVPKLNSVDSRSKFLEAFHNLLYRTAVFYQEDADTTVHADAFPLLNALREVHLLLAEGAHNQFGELPWTARVEMLIQQWFLSRPELREFLRGRAMVPYQEPWMGQVDTMKRLQGWSEASITHFHELAVYGEQLLLSIRYHDWTGVNDPNEAKLWARNWKAEIQRYIHGYLSVTGVDLTVEITDSRQAANRYLQPSVHLQQRTASQRVAARGPNAALPAPASTTRRVVRRVSTEYDVLPSEIPNRLLISRDD